MQILIYVFLAIAVLVATFFWIKYELECEHSYELEDKLCEANYELKKRTKLMLVADKVQEYKKRWKCLYDYERHIRYYCK